MVQFPVLLGTPPDLGYLHFDLPASRPCDGEAIHPGTSQALADHLAANGTTGPVVWADDDLADCPQAVAWARCDGIVTLAPDSVLGITNEHASSLREQLAGERG